MNIAIITSGGDSSGMNAAIKHFVEKTYQKNNTPYFIYEGLEGLIDNKIKKASLLEVENIINQGGTIIKSSRSKRFFEKSYRKIAYQNLKNNKIEAIVVLGGDGTFKAFDIFYKEFHIPFIAIPATIDNDIGLNEYSIGVDTALNMIRTSIDAIRDTASSFKRAFIIETMGRESGYLALTSAISNSANMCLIPEVKYNLNNLKEKFITQLKNNEIDYILAVVAEGLHISEYLKFWFEKEINIEARITILGHIQRGGSPTTLERLRAIEFTDLALNEIEKNPNKVITYYKNKFVSRTIEEVVNSKYSLDKKMIEISKSIRGV